MVQLRRTEVYDRWFRALGDPQAKARIEVRIDRLVLGNAGDVRPVGEGVSELRVHHGPGYRIYFMRRGDVIIVLLCGGDKSRQSGDIAQAKSLARQWEE